MKLTLTCPSPDVIEFIVGDEGVVRVACVVKDEFETAENTPADISVTEYIV